MDKKPQTVQELIAQLTANPGGYPTIAIAGTYWKASVMDDIANTLRRRFNENQMGAIMGDNTLKLNILEQIALHILCNRAGVEIPEKPQ